MSKAKKLVKLFQHRKLGDIQLQLDFRDLWIGLYWDWVYDWTVDNENQKIMLIYLVLIPGIVIHTRCRYRDNNFIHGIFIGSIFAANLVILFDYFWIVIRVVLPYIFSLFS